MNKTQMDALAQHFASTGRVFVSWDDASERGSNPFALAEGALNRREHRRPVWIHEVKRLDSGKEYQIPALVVESQRQLRDMVRDHAKELAKGRPQ